MAHKAIDVAKAILRLSEPDKGDIVSNLKLQKLLYYVQGFSLVILGEPMFEEEIEAWEYGPVVRDVYCEFKPLGAAAIIPDAELDAGFLSDEQFHLIKEVYEVYGQFSALRLMHMTHEEPPWKTTYRNGANSIISHESMRAYFSGVID
ncbi:MAG: DUF4065 domain-containing protein [Rikenellaceae bacterium]|jgi:uncharacterized phage-associated protein|nr:DUF4065 domain-containing protein [Rikenellaceae bacterium]